jgi:hypothetical protein
MDRPDPLDDLDDLARELRTSVGGEFRRWAEEDEYAARKTQLRSRTLEHIAHELLSRGDAVAVTLGSTVLHGTVVHAKGDLMALETRRGDRIDLRLGGPLTIRVVARSSDGGRGRDVAEPGSFVARLRELELDEVPVMLTPAPGSDTVTGVIEAVAEDHLMVTGDDGETTYIAMSNVVAVTRR